MNSEKLEQFLEELKYVTEGLDEESQKYLAELEKVHKHICCRSTITLAWGTIMLYLYKIVEKYGLSRFPVRIIEFEDLSNEQDDKIISYLFGEGNLDPIITNANLKKALIELKDERNRAAHVNNWDCTEGLVDGFLEKSIIVIKKLKEQIKKKDGFNREFYNTVTPERYEEFITHLRYQEHVNFLNFLFDKFERRSREIEITEETIDSESEYMSKDLKLLQITVKKAYEEEKASIVESVLRNLNTLIDKTYIILLLKLIFQIENLKDYISKENTFVFSIIIKHIYETEKDVFRSSILTDNFEQYSLALDLSTKKYIEEDMKPEEEVQAEPAPEEEPVPEDFAQEPELNPIQNSVFQSLIRFNVEAGATPEQILTDKREEFTQVASEVESEIKDEVELVDWKIRPDLQKLIIKNAQRVLLKKYEYGSCKTIAKYLIQYLKKGSQENVADE